MIVNRIFLERYNQEYKHKGLMLRLLWILVSSIFFRSSFPFPSKLKSLILRAFGADVGVGVVIKPAVNIKYPWLLSLRDHCWVGEAVWIDNLAKVEIGESACISQGAYLLTGNHNAFHCEFKLIVKPIALGQGAWVGAKAIVCPGVTLEDGAMLTAGSVATKNLAGWSIYQGNPAVLKKKRNIVEVS